MRTLVAIVLGIMLVAGGTPASAIMTDHCPHTPTVAALRSCVQHAVAEGAIASPELARSLYAKLDASAAAVGRGQPTVAANILDALRAEVQAQSGKQIEAEHANHLSAHTQYVIDTLRGVR